MHGVSAARYRSWRSTKLRMAQEGGEGPTEETAGGSTRLKLIIIAVIVVIIGGVTAAVYYQPASSNSGGGDGLKMSLGTVKVISADSSSVTLSVPVILQNTVAQDITFYGASFVLSENSATVSQGYLRDGEVVPAGATKVTNQTVFIDLGDVVQTQAVQTSASWRIQGTADIRTASGNATVPFDFNFKT